MASETLALAERLGIALVLGLLIGLERGWELRELPEGNRVAGLRTFGLIGLLGAVMAILAHGPAASITAALTLGLVALLAISYWRETQHESELGATTAVAALVTFGLGALAGEGKPTPAAAAAVVVALLLGFKPELHSLLQRIDRDELLATLRLLLISVVLLPILPDRGYGPWQSINPYQLWWMVVLVAAISYAGYVLSKVYGAQRGALLTGFLGGLVSSTAVSVSHARRASEDRESENYLGAGVVIASTTMFPRMLVIAGAVASALIAPLLWPIVPATITGVIAAAWYGRGKHQKLPDSGSHPVSRNPLDLTIALEFGVLLAVIMVAAHAAVARFGTGGLYLVAALDGLADVDAITLTSAAMLQQGRLELPPALVAILIAAAVNTVVKPIIVTVIAGWRMGSRSGAALLLTLIAGAVGFYLMILRWAP